MSSFQILAIPTETVEAVRGTEKAPHYGFPAHEEVAARCAPCRHCLRLIRLNARRSCFFLPAIRFVNSAFRPCRARSTSMPINASETWLLTRFRRSTTDER